MFKNLFKPIDMTKGKIYKNIILFTLPILISYLLQQVYALTDAIIVGQSLSASEVNGLNDVGAILFIILQFAFGCCAGFSVISSNKKGQNDEKGLRQSFFVQIVLSVFISIILTIVSILLMDPLLNLVGLSLSQGGLTYKSAKTYLFYIFLGIIFQVIYNQIVSLLRSLGDSLTPLLFLLLSTILNVGLDVLFIICFKMGVKGAAIATVTAQGVSAILCYIYTFIKYPFLRFKKDELKISFSYYLEHLKQGLPLAFQFSILGFGLITMQATIIKFDTTIDGIVIDNGPAQLAYGAINKLQNFLMCPLEALCTAMLPFVGQNKGANNMKRAKEGVKQAFIIMIVICLFILLISFLLLIDNAFLKMFYSETSINEEAINFGRINIFVAFPFYIALGTLFILRGAIQGTEKPLFPFLAGVIELVARILICLFLPNAFSNNISTSLDSFENPWPYIATVFADPFAWIMGAIVLIIGYYLIFYKAEKPSKN